MNRDIIVSHWQQFLASGAGVGAGGEPYPAEQFGDSSAMADELGQLIVAGRKTATCAALWEYDAENKPLPPIGGRTIVLDGRDVPLCIIESTEIEIRRFADVDSQFAFDEGEDDRTLESWRREHWRYFSRALPRIGREPSEDMRLMCERFRVVFRW